MDVNIDEKRGTPLFNIPKEKWKINWQIEPKIEVVILQGEMNPVPTNQTMYTIGAEEFCGLAIYDETGTSVKTINLRVMEMAETNWKEKGGEFRWTAAHGWSFSLDPEVSGIEYVFFGNGDFYIELFGIYNTVSLIIEAYY
jgi:hypothetical protein